MARVQKQLSAKTVVSLKEPGRYADGGGLYLQVGPTGSKSWLFFFRRHGKRREMGLGAALDVSLAEARGKAADARRILAEGTDPIEARDVALAARKQTVVAPTFGAFADRMLEKWAPKFRNDKHLAQWKMTLGPAYCAKIRDRKLAHIATAAAASP